MALVILRRVPGTELLPLQVEKIDKERRGGEGMEGRGRKGKGGEHRCPDRWAWPPACLA